MDEAPYSNRQIELLLDKQSADIKSHVDAATSPILAQTTATNGRVTKLETTVAENAADIDRLQRIAWIIGILAGAAWALVLAVVSGIAGNIHF